MQWNCPLGWDLPITGATAPFAPKAFRIRGLVRLHTVHQEDAQSHELLF